MPILLYLIEMKDKDNRDLYTVRPLNLLKGEIMFVIISGELDDRGFGLKTLSCHGPFELPVDATHWAELHIKETCGVVELQCIDGWHDSII